jgi:hypothetical protein
MGTAAVRVRRYQGDDMTLSCRLFSKALGLVAALTLSAVAAAHALDDRKQLMVAGSSQGTGAIQYSAPGMSNVFSQDFPDTGLGPLAASIRMPAGTLGNLKVNVVTQNTPSSGNLRVRVLVNQAATAITCVVTGTGICNKNSTIPIANNDLLTLRISNTFPDSGVIAWTATLEFD